MSVRVLLCLAMLSACSDYGFECIETTMASHTEEVSSLESTQGPMDTHADAVVMTRDPVPPGARWRIQSVEVLLLINGTEWESHPTDVPLTVQVFDGPNPRIDPLWSVTQTVDIESLSWESVYLSRGSGPMTEWYMAWLPFDFSRVRPGEGLSSEEYVVGVAWVDSRWPMVGYSQHNRACERNWTRYLYPNPLASPPSKKGRGDWQWNGDWSQGCSWPMFRVTAAVYEGDGC